jgi:hypothetical protein
MVSHRNHHHRHDARPPSPLVRPLPIRLPLVLDRGPVRPERRARHLRMGAGEAARLSQLAVDRIADGRSYRAEQRNDRARFWSSMIATEPRAPLEKISSAPDLRELKAEMARAHPDRGGSSEAFRKAYAAYVAAKGEPA